MAEENQDEDLGQEVFLDDQTEEDTSSTETDEPVSDAQVADAAARVEEGEDNLEDYSASGSSRTSSPSPNRARRVRSLLLVLQRLAARNRGASR